MPITVSSTGEEQTFEPIPKGNYEAFVNSIKKKQTSGNDDMLNIRFVIADGQLQGRSLFANFVLTEESKWKLIQLLISTGLMQPKTKQDVTLSDDYAELIGKRCGLKVKDGEYNGEARPEVFGFFRPNAVIQAHPGTPAPVVAAGAVPPPPVPTSRRL